MFKEWSENCENGRQRRWMGMEEARQNIKNTQLEMLEQSIRVWVGGETTSKTAKPESLRNEWKIKEIPKLTNPIPLASTAHWVELCPHLSASVCWPPPSLHFVPVLKLLINRTMKSRHPPQTLERVVPTIFPQKRIKANNKRDKCEWMINPPPPPILSICSSFT